MSIRVFRVTHPLTGERFHALLSWTRDVNMGEIATVRFKEEFGKTVMGNMTLQSQGRYFGYARIHSFIGYEWRGRGLGVLFYLATARLVASMKFKGIYTAPGRSTDADRVWQRLRDNGLATCVDTDTCWLDAKVARKYVPVQYLGKLGAPLRHGATW